MQMHMWRIKWINLFILLVFTVLLYNSGSFCVKAADEEGLHCGVVNHECSMTCVAPWTSGACPAGLDDDTEPVSCEDKTSRYCNCNQVTDETDSWCVDKNTFSCPSGYSNKSCSLEPDCKLAESDPNTWYTCTCKRTVCSGCIIESKAYVYHNGHPCSNNTKCHKCTCTPEPKCTPSPCTARTRYRNVEHTKTCDYVTCPYGQNACLYKLETEDCKHYTNEIVHLTQFKNNTPLVRFNATGNVRVSINDNDPGDRVTVSGISYSNHCGYLYQNNVRVARNTNIRPFRINNLNYARNWVFIPATDPHNLVDNTCSTDITLQIKDTYKRADGTNGPGVTAEDATYDSESIDEATIHVDVYYPPTELLRLRLLDRNKQSVAGLDGASPPNMIENTSVQVLGGLGEDPLQYNFPPDLLKPPEVMFQGVPFTYKRSDTNPIDVLVDLWDENGPNDINPEKQEVILVSSTGLELPINRGTGQVNNSILGLFDPIGAITHKAPDTTGYTTFTDMANCLVQTGDLLCTRRINVQLVPGKNGIQAKRLTIRMYQSKLPESSYYFRIKTTDNEGATWEKDFPNVRFSVDNTPPAIENFNLIACGARVGDCRTGSGVLGGDVLRLQFTIKDNYALPNNAPLFATTIFANNDDVSQNHFLKAWDPATNTIVGNIDGTGYGNKLKYRIRKISNHEYRYTLYVTGARADEEVYYGMCAYDRAGNIACAGNIMSLNRGGPTPSITPPVLEVGTNWLKTSLGNVYSRGGFTGLPDYHSIHGVKEEPFLRSLVPLNANQAVIGNLAIVTDGTAGLGSIVWGFNGFYNNPLLQINDRVINQEVDWYNELKQMATLRCGDLGNLCELRTASTAPSLTALTYSNLPYKVITIASSIDVQSNVVCRGATIIFIDAGTVKFSRNIYKYESAPSSLTGRSQVTPLADDKNGCLFILGPNNNAKLVIDDNPFSSAVINGTLQQHDLATGDGMDIDLIQAGIIGFSTSSTPDDPQFKVLQSPRDDYRDSEGYFDNLTIHGFVYTLGIPVFERDLTYSDNKQYPAEWIIYDSSLMNVYEPLLGRPKVQTIRCGVIEHPWCRLSNYEREGLE